MKLDDAKKTRAVTVLPPPQLGDKPVDPDDPLAQWIDVDLQPALRGERARLIPTIGSVKDGSKLFYAGQVNWVFGDSGSGKSMAVLRVAVEQIKAGRPVVWLDLEDPGEAPIVERMLAMGATPDEIVAFFHYKRPDTPLNEDAVALVIDECLAYEPALLVLDSLGEAFGIEGINEDKDADVGPYLRHAVRPLTATGAAVVVIDHTTKASDRSLHPSGSKRKRAATTGVMYLVEMKVPFSKDKPGMTRFVCTKDRHGTYARGETVAEVKVRPHPDGTLTLYIDRPAPAPRDAETGEFRPTHVMEKMSKYIASHPGPNVRKLRDAIGGRSDVVDKARELLLGEDYIENRGSKTRPSFHSLKKYRAADDQRVTGEGS